MSLARFETMVQDTAGNVIASPTVEVRKESDNTLAAVYSDRAGSSALGNPFTGGSDGSIGFHVAGGAYKITITSGAFSRTLRYVGIGTYQEVDYSGGIIGDVLAANNLSELASKGAAFDILSVHAADVASASTINLDTAPGVLIDVTGTTTITAITLAEGHVRIVRFTGVLTLTHGSSLVLPNAQPIITKAGDMAIFVGYAAGVVRCASFIPFTHVSFSATNSANQNIPDNTFTAVTFDTENFDVGNLFASNVWTPPAGKILLIASILLGGTYTAGATIAFTIGGKQFSGVSVGTTGGTVNGAVVASANGSQTFGLSVYCDTTGGNGVLNGTGNLTFIGIWLGP